MRGLRIDLERAAAAGWRPNGFGSVERELPSGGVERVAITAFTDDDYSPPDRSASRSVGLGSGRARGTAPTVEFTGRALARLLHEIRETLDGREACGALFGYRDGDRIVIEDVGPSSPGSFRSTSETAFDLGHAASLERWHARRGSGCRLIGDWHTHPNGAEPSDADQRAWRAGASLTGGDWVGVIADCSLDQGFPYFTPELLAWTASRGDGGCRAARIIERSTR